MPLLKSAKKALRQDAGRKVRNLKAKREMKKLLKDTQENINQSKKEEVKKLLPKIYKNLDKAVKKGLIKKNSADRKKSRITKAINKK